MLICVIFCSFTTLNHLNLMIIFLIGYMGSGKYSIEIRLSKKLDYNIIDLDDCISKKENASVKEISEKKVVH